MSGGSAIVNVIVCTFLICNIKAMIIVEKPNIPDPQRPQLMLEYPLDLAFIMDSTGSMSSYIKSVKENIQLIVQDIVESSKSDVRLALIEYRDHSPEERTFVTRTHDFTESVSVMKSWLWKTKARGGGDTPEAVADALYESTKLSWRPESAKISILISDAPPHGLYPSIDSSFHQGCPDGHDPMEIVRELARLEVTLYSVGCEPSIIKYKDFFEALAFLTGGQYVPMSDPRRLIDVITGGAQEELSLKQFSSEVRKEVVNAVAEGRKVDEQQIAQSVFVKLNALGARSKHLMKNKKALKGPSEGAKLIAKDLSMAYVRKTLNTFLGGVKNKLPRTRATFLDDMMKMRRMRTGRRLETRYGKTRRPSFREMSEGMAPRISYFRPPMFRGVAVKPRISHHESSVDTYSGSRGSGSKDTFSTVESGISLDQVTRMVRKETSKL